MRRAAAAAAESREAAIAASQRVRIDTPSLSGSINLTGARIDDVRLKHYHVTVDDEFADDRAAQPVQALPNGYFAEVGFVGSDDAGTRAGRRKRSGPSRATRR